MARATYLADTSAFTRIAKPDVAAAIAPLIAEGRVALCAPVAFKLGFSTRNRSDHQAIMSRIEAFEFAPTTEGDLQRALELQRLLTDRSQHRALSLVDALVAAVAETRQLTILHYGADFELVSAVTGQPAQWIVEPDTAD